MAISKDEQHIRLSTLVHDLQNQNFFGEVRVKMQQGNIIQAVISQSIKLEESAKVVIHEAKDK